MRFNLASHIMPRTTLNIDGPVLDDLRKLAARERKPLGRVASDLLAEAAARRTTRRRAEPRRRLGWTSRQMGAQVDLTDKEALFAALEEKAPGKRTRAR